MSRLIKIVLALLAIAALGIVVSFALIHSGGGSRGITTTTNGITK